MLCALVFLSLVGTLTASPIRFALAAFHLDRTVGAPQLTDAPVPPSLAQRQSKLTGDPDRDLWYTLSTTETGDSNCLFSILGVDGSVPYPVRFESCDPLKDDALWRFVPDGQGRYFVYNKAWKGTGQRLDIYCSEPSLCVMWMGPSGDIYNNQRWFLVGRLSSHVGGDRAHS